MKKSSIRLVAMLLCVLMCMSIMPTEALAYTEPAAAVSNGGVKITSQPQDKSAVLSNSNKATFKVEASGKNLKYQWFCKKGSGSWEKIAGATKAKLTVTVKENMDGWKYRCRVSSGSTKVYSKAAELNVANASTKYRALLIGEVSFSPKCARNKGDVQLMKSMLNKVKGPKGGRYKITCKYDLTKAGIKNAIKNTFKGAKKSDVSLFFIATHGDASTTGYGAGALAVSPNGSLLLDDLASALQAIPGKVIVILESCGSGAAVFETYAEENDAAANAIANAKAFDQAVIDAFAAADTGIVTNDVENTGEFRVENKF